MTYTVHIVLEGLPERVQEVADALDKALPNAFDWNDFASISGETDIVLKGSASRGCGIVASLTLTTPEECNAWTSAPADETLVLQRPLSDVTLVMVGRGK